MPAPRRQPALRSPCLTWPLIRDTANNTLVKPPIAVGSEPVGVAISPDGGFVYVTGGPNNTVSVINTATKVVQTIQLASGTQPAGVSVTPNSEFAFVANFNSGTVSRIDTLTNIVINTIPVGASPVAFGSFIGQYLADNYAWCCRRHV
jgi:YVTN family beta-propeller protein